MYTLQTIGIAINNLFVRGPLHNLYHNGPMILGFWGGADNSHICATLSNAPISLWITNSNECLQLIERHFNSMYTCVNFLIYIIMFYNCLSTFVFYVTISRPFQTSIKHMTKKMMDNDKK